MQEEQQADRDIGDPAEHGHALPCAGTMLAMMTVQIR